MSTVLRVLKPRILEAGSVSVISYEGPYLGPLDKASVSYWSHNGPNPYLMMEIHAVSKIMLKKKKTTG
jgi:hypothetical protein